MPQTLLRAMEIMQGRDTPDVADVVELVEHDPGVVARVLRIANSAYYGQRAEITVVRRAVVVLGPGTVVGLVMSMGMAEMQQAFDDRTMAPFLEIVQHCVATAYIAQEMTREDDPSGEDDSASEAFTAGLLHDIGKLVLLYNHPSVGNELYRAATPDNLLLDEEERAFGTNHVRVGAAVAEKLHLPEVLKYVIHHHHATNGEASQPLVHRIRQANHVAHALGFPAQITGELDHGNMLDPELFERWMKRRDDVTAYVENIV